MLTSETKITSCIDWLSMTTKTTQHITGFSPLKEELPKGMMGYDTAVKYIDGRVELCSSNRKHMGVHTIYSGSTIARICEMAIVDSFEVFKKAANGKCTRIDLAVDIKYGTLDIQELFQHLETDKVETRIQTWLHMVGAKGNGETLYIGAPKSQRRMRIYDKQAEQDTDYEWTRVELQFRHQFAQRAAQTLLASKEPHKQIAKMVASFIDFNNSAEWQIVMGSETIEMGKPEPSNGDRKQWLLTTAASALAKEMVLGNDGEKFLQTFISATLAKYKTQKSKFK